MQILYQKYNTSDNGKLSETQLVKKIDLGTRYFGFQIKAFKTSNIIFNTALHKIVFLKIEISKTHMLPFTLKRKQTLKLFFAFAKKITTIG